MAMNYLLDKKYDETFTINFIGSEEFHPGDTLKLTMPTCFKNIKAFNGYTDTRSGETSSVYLKVYFRYKYSTDVDWSETSPIENLPLLEVCSRKCLLLQLLYYRLDDGGANNNITITLTNPSISGTYTMTKGDAFIVLTSGDTAQILELGDYLKIFSITDFDVISTPRYTNGTFTIKYRFSQDGKMTWTEWEPLTKENISTVHWDTTRFVEMQYLFELNPSIRTNIKIYEVILYGDFQNVSANAYKMNLFGLKENCVNIAFPPASITTATSGIDTNTATTNTKSPDSTSTTLINEASEYQLRMNWVTYGMSCYSNTDTSKGLSVTDQLAMENEANSAGFWNPYEFGKITEWQNMLATQIAQMLGMTVEYHLTDPDGNGIDKVIHEQQLYNIVDMKIIKVLVPDNQFPENQIVINQFNLDLFDTFKVHVLKSDFKKVFGITKRPGQQDILYFCQINRMFIIKHAQIHKDVMNSGIYYDVVLEKYEKRANVINRIEESKNRIEELTRNTTIDELFGFEEKNDMDKIANKLQLKPESFDYIRSVINARTTMTRENIYNGDVKVIESYYDFSNVAQTENAILYTKADNNVKVSDNRSFIFWFNLPNDYDEGKAITKRMIAGYDVSANRYVMLNNLTGDTLVTSSDSYTNNIGYKIWLQSDKIFYMINNVIHTMDVNLLTNVWYCLLINMDQRQRTCEMKLLRRNTAITVVLFQPDTYEKLELDSVIDAVDIAYEKSVNGFKAVNNIETTSTEVTPTFIEESTYTATNVALSEFTHDVDFRITGSKMKLSNIRIMNDLVRSDVQQIILNELIVKDAQHLIMGDNATKKIFTTNYENKNWR